MSTATKELRKALAQTNAAEVSTQVVRRRLTDAGLTHEAAVADIHCAIANGHIRLTDGFMLALTKESA